MREQLKKKIDVAIKLIKSAGAIANANGQELEICYSGGKDSDVILELAKMAGIKYRAIYKNTTIDPPGTIKHVKSNGVEIIAPKKSFFQLIREHGLPSNRKRFCCKYLKEYKVLDYSVVGIRRCESRKRMERYKEPEACRVYSKNERVRQYYPILYWDDKDVEDFIRERNIKCAPIYYDEEGVFHVERRLGCMGCPLLDKERVKQFLKYPNLIKSYARSLRVFRETHPTSKVILLYNDEYEQLVRDIFYWRKTQKEWDAMNRNSLFPKIDYKSLLEKYFKISFDD